MTHRRRAKSLKAIHFNNDMNFGGDMKVFLSNNKNKQRFIHTLGEKLLLHGCRVICCERDADVDIIMTAITLAQETHVIVIGEDTDLLVLLLNHFNEQHLSNNIYFRSDRKKTGKEGVVHNIRNYRNVLGEDMCQCLLFLHSFTGCDTTSALVRVHTFSR